jgi:hypothetical protein
MGKHSSKPAKERRAKDDRRGGVERRVRQIPVEVDRRKGGDRRSGLDRRVELATAGDQLHAAISLLNFAVEKGVMLDVDRWVLETAITRLKIALAKLDEDEEP